MTSLAWNASAARGLEQVRRDFIASLPRRVDALTRALTVLAAEPSSTARREEVLRKVQATAAGARALGLEVSSRVLDGAAARLQAAAIRGPLSATAIAELERTIGTIAEVVAQDRGQEPEARAALPTSPGALGVLVFGPAPLAASVAACADAVDVQTVDSPDDLPERVLALAPDVVVLDGDRPGSREAVEALASAGLVDAPAMVVVGTFDGAESMGPFAALGVARVVAQPASPETLGRAIRAALAERALPRGGGEPVGDVTIAGLAERVAEEVRRGLVSAAEPGSEGLTVPCGEGVEVLSAVWASVARIRELVTMRSGGAVRFRATGPEGAIPLAPWASGERRTRGPGRRQATSVDVPLARRRAIVADDDPAVVWFLSDLLRSAGVEVVEAHDGERALELALRTAPDVVITDVLMPRRDGFSLARELRRDVAVRDVPVILLSWKEDLLERARELGAEADGYLRKEATAPVVLERVREALRSRSRVEARLRHDGEVQGRLDGLSLRWILELVSAHRPDSRLSVRDAAYLYEVELRDGRPRSVTRTAADGSFEAGAVAVAALLGVSVGRFAVRPATDPCRHDFDASLAEVIAPPIERARAVLRAIGATRLPRVARIEIDPARLGAYGATLPGDAAVVLQRLVAGASPSALLGAGSVPSRVVTDLLDDLARRGAVGAVVGLDGEDLVSGGAEPDVRRSPPALNLPTPSPMFTFAFSPAPGPVSEAPAGELTAFPQQPVAAESLATALPQVAPTHGSAAPAVATAPGPSSVEVAAPLAPSAAESALARSEPAPATAAPSVPSSASSSLAASEPVAAARGEGAAGEAAPTPAEADLTGDGDLRAADEDADDPAADAASVHESARPPAAGEPLDAPRPAPEAASAAVDAASASPGSEVAPESSEGCAPDAAADASAAPAEVSAAPAEADVSAAPGASAAPELLEGSVPIKRRIQFPVRRDPAPPAPAVAGEPAAPAPLRGSDADGARPSEAPSAPAAPNDRGPTVSSERAELSELPARRIAFPARSRAGAGEAEGPRPGAPSATFSASDPSPSAEAGGGSVNDDLDGDEIATSVTPPHVASSRVEAVEESARPPSALPKRLRGAVLGGLRVAGITAATALVSFGAVRVLFAPAGSATDSAPAAAASAAAVVAASAVVAPAAPASAVAPLPEARIELLDLPPGFVVPDGKGMVEVVTPGRESIYVDGTFVGRGPTRRVPLAPGSHGIEIRGEGEARHQKVELPSGRRLRAAFSG